MNAVFTQSAAQKDTCGVVILNEVKDLILKLSQYPFEFSHASLLPNHEKFPGRIPPSAGPVIASRDLLLWLTALPSDW